MSYLITLYAEQIPESGNINEMPKNDYFPEFNSYKEVKKSFLGIRISYNDLKNKHIKEEPETQ